MLSSLDEKRTVRLGWLSFGHLLVRRCQKERVWVFEVAVAVCVYFGDDGVLFALRTCLCSGLQACRCTEQILMSLSHPFGLASQSMPESKCWASSSVRCPQLLLTLIDT